ncbi:hypothetical protein ACH5RR_019104 [Cinchona calisaya]|uniref:Uncharacterized protein n=1 Tax=Cinchona calisaya TaxID=153742 RepID=A0ABD2ZND9_9GENT
MAGEVERAFDLIRHLAVWEVPVWRKKRSFQQQFGKLEPILSRVMKMLSVEDRYIFWITCCYYIVYRKVPDPMVGMIGREQLFLPLKWPPTEIPKADRGKLFFLLAQAEDSVFSDQKAPDG